MSHAGSIWDAISKAQAERRSPKEIALLYTESIIRVVYDLGGVYHPHVGRCTQAVFNADLKYWLQNVQKITDPSDKAEVVIRALKKWANATASYDYMKTIPDMGERFIAGPPKDGRASVGTNALIVLDVQASRIRQALVEAKKVFLDLEKKSPEILSQEMQKLSEADSIVIMDLVIKADFSNSGSIRFVSASAIDGVDFELF